MKFKEWIADKLGISQIESSSTYPINSQPIILKGLNGNDVYMSDFVNNCIDRTASEISKIKIKSVVVQNGTAIANDDITRLFRFKPNEYQTTSDFLSAIEWTRRKHMNCWIYPQ